MRRRRRRRRRGTARVQCRGGGRGGEGAASRRKRRREKLSAITNVSVAQINSNEMAEHGNLCTITSNTTSKNVNVIQAVKT